MIYALARPALFALDPETAHALTLALLSRFPRGSTAAFARPLPAAPVTLMGLDFRNRVGLAAGLDKDAACIEAFDRLGFGFIEVGTVTPRPQPGNPRPRLFRLARYAALINRMGFNSAGLDVVVPRLERARARMSAVLGVNLGKNAATPVERAIDDYVAGLERVHALAGYVTLNLSSPNTEGLRALQAPGALGGFLDALGRARDRLADRDGRRTPVLLKLAPELAPDELGAVADLARTRGIDGLIATNTTTTRPDLDAERLAAEAGGLSGRPLKALAATALQDLRARLGPDYPLVGSGGIMHADDARARHASGADLVQLYTGLIYSGPALVGDCVRALLPPSTGVR